MTYHPGRILKVIKPEDGDVKSSDDDILVNLKMWDGNVFTFIVADEISGEVARDDVVLVDYTPKKDLKVPVATQKVVRVLKGETGEEVWENYKNFQNTKRKKQIPQTSPVPQPSYMG